MHVNKLINDQMIYRNHIKLSWSWHGCIYTASTPLWNIHVGNTNQLISIRRYDSWFLISLTIFRNFTQWFLTYFRTETLLNIRLKLLTLSLEKYMYTQNIYIIRCFLVASQLPADFQLYLIGQKSVTWLPLVKSARKTEEVSI